MELARDYLSRLRSKCGEDTELYQEFLRIMRDFKHGSINARMVIDQVAELFKNDTSLIAEFNNFLPEELRLQIPQNDCEYAAAFVKKVKNIAPEIYNEFISLLSKYKEGEKSVNEVCDLSSILFASYPELLKEFVLFIPELSNNSNKNDSLNSCMTDSNQINSKSSSGSLDESLDKSEFLSYLANTVYSITTKSEPPKIVTRKASSNLPYDMTVVPELDRILENQKKRLSNIEDNTILNNVKSDTNLSHNQINNEKEYPQKNINQSHYYYNPEDLSIWEADYRIFEEVYIAFGENCHEYYQDFLKLIHLYTRGVLTVVETLLALEFFFPMDSGDLPYEVKRMIVQRESSRRKYSYFCCNFAQLDYSNSARNGSSYLHLPDDYPIASCTGRIVSDKENLNDKWVSIPQGSEDFSFKHMRKNVYEENLFKCEDERFELDMVIENNRSTINVLEPIAEEISKLPPEEKKNFKLVKPPFSIIHLKSISRIYGDNGSEILELLKRTPYSCIPVILNRLRQKDEEWTHARHLMNQGVWRDIQTKNYFKSFDHRSFYFRQADKKNTNVKGFLCEINKAYLNNRKLDESGNTNRNNDNILAESQLTKNEIQADNESQKQYNQINTPLRYRNESNGWSVNPEFSSCMPDLDVHKEVIELISFTIYRQANGPAVGSKARNFLQRFVRSLFLQTNYSSDNGLVTLKELQNEGTSFKAGVKSLQNGITNGNFNVSTSNGPNCGEKSLLTVEAYVNAVTESNGSNSSIPFNNSGLSRGRRMTRNHLKKSNTSVQISENSKTKSSHPNDGSKSQNSCDEVIDCEDSNIPKTSCSNVNSADSSVSAEEGNNIINSNNSENISSNEENDLNTLFKSFSSSYDCRGGLKYIWSDNCKVSWHTCNLSPDWFSNNNDFQSNDCKKENDTIKNESQGETSLVRYILGNDHICCFLRYYQIIYERLRRAKVTIEQREQNPLPFQRWSPNGPDVPRPTYKQVIWCCFGLLSGELELSLFEDICRDAMGNDSYWLGTIDKVLQGISKVVIHIVNDLATCRLLAMNLAYRDTIFDHYKKLEEFIASCRSLLPTIQTSFYIITWSPKTSTLKIRMRQLEDYSLTFVPFIQNEANLDNMVENLNIENLSTETGERNEPDEDFNKNSEQEQIVENDHEGETVDSNNTDTDTNNTNLNVDNGLKVLSNMKLFPPEKAQYLTSNDSDVKVGLAIDLTNHVELLQQILVHQLTNLSDEIMESSETIKLDQFTEKENDKISKLLLNNPVSFFVCLDRTFVKPLLYYSPKMKFVAKLAASSQWLGFLPDSNHRDIARSPSILRESGSSNSLRHNNESRKVNRRNLISNENPNQTDDDKGHWSEESAESNSRAVISTNVGRRGSGRKRTRGMPSDIVTEIDDLDIRVTRRRSGNTSRGFRRN